MTDIISRTLVASVHTTFALRKSQAMMYGIILRAYEDVMTSYALDLDSRDDLRMADLFGTANPTGML